MLDFSNMKMQNTSAMSTESEICRTSASNVLLQADVQDWVDVYSADDSTNIYLMNLSFQDGLLHHIPHSSQQGEGIRRELDYHMLSKTITMTTTATTTTTTTTITL